MDNTVTLNINDLTQEERNQIISKSKKKRKFRAMTISEHCTYRKTGCNGCEYRQSLTYWDYYCDYSDFNQVNKWHDRNKPYKTKDGKYILIEVE